MKRHAPRKIVFRLLLIGLFAGFLAPCAGIAQTPADIQAAQRQAEMLQRQEQERLRLEQEEARRRSGRVDGMDTNSLKPQIEVPAIGPTCREIRVIVINGAPNLPAAVRERISREFGGRCLNVVDIERILGEITAHYIERGFITTRAYLPPQDLSKGRLEILVIEGVVEKIMIEDGDAGSISIGNVLPGIEGGLLNLRDLEQGIDQINRLPSNNAQLEIQPGEKPGASNVVIRNKPGTPFRANVSIDNHGSESTGARQVAVTGGVDNLLGLNEMMSITHRESSPGSKGRKYSGSDSLNFSIPFGYSTLSFGANRSRYFSPISLPSGLELIARGSSDTDYFRLDRVMYRDQSSRASLAATLTTKSSKNYLDTQFLSVSSRNLTVLDIDGNLSTGLAGGVLSLDAGYARGLDMMGALHDPDNLPDQAARAQFEKFKGGFSFLRPFRLFEKDFSFTSQLIGQKARNVLYGSEQMYIGSLYSVRGFTRNSLSGDDGYYWRNEISVRQPLVLGSETIFSRLYAGYDLGEVSNRAPNVPQGRLAGMVIGLSINWRGLSFDVFKARPLALPDTMSKEPGNTWFRIAYSI